MSRNYQSGAIYKLFVEGLEEFCYIGSTTNSLSQRLCLHRHQAFNDKQNKSASSQMFADGCEPKIVLLEAQPCDTKEELEKRERQWIEKFPDCINKNIPTRTDKERWIANKEKYTAKHKEWIANNKESINAYVEAYKPKARENDKKRMEALNNNPEEKAKWLEKRREIKNRQKTCEKCGHKTSAGNMWRHKATCA